MPNLSHSQETHSPLCARAQRENACHGRHDMGARLRDPPPPGCLPPSRRCSKFPFPLGRGPGTAMDYEAEYNNRALVPEHPQIFDRWAREAAAYRAEAVGEGRAELALAYGPLPRQTIDLFS